MVQPIANINTNSDPKIQNHPAAGIPDQKKKGKPDVFMLTWLLLAESVRTSTESIAIRSKAISSNAAAQQQGNLSLQNMKLASVPKRDVKHVTKSIDKLTNPEKNRGRHVKGDRYTFETIVNQTVVTLVENKNQAILDARQGLQDHLNVLQQNASIDETKISTENNQAVQMTQESVGFLDLIKEMTFDANLTRPPQGA